MTEVQPNETWVGVTGHRTLGSDPRTPFRVHAQCVRLLDRLAEDAAAQSRRLVAVSALAAGADSLFAEAALGLGLPLIGVLPCERYADEFDDAGKRRLESLLGLCERVERLPFLDCGGDAYLAAGVWIVERCEFLVAAWDRQPGRGIGGTAQVVERANALNKPVLYIPVTR
jgi:hypothetical protein